MKQRNKKPSKRLKGDSPERFCKHQPHTHTHKQREQTGHRESIFSDVRRQNKIVCAERSVHLVDTDRSWAFSVSSACSDERRHRVGNLTIIDPDLS